MKIVDTLFNFVIFIQFMNLLIFVILNYTNLDSIPLTFTIKDIEFNIVLNLYAVIVVIIAIFAVIILLSLSILGTGMNDEGTKISERTLGYIVLFTLMSIPSILFIELFEIFVIIELFYAIVYFMKVVDQFVEK